jgi:hypothetical protein
MVVAAAKTPKERVDEIARGKEPRKAASAVYIEARGSSETEFVFEAWKFLALPGPHVKKDDAAMSKKYAKDVAVLYLKMPNASTRDAGLVRHWITGYEKENLGP